MLKIRIFKIHKHDLFYFYLKDNEHNTSNEVVEIKWKGKKKNLKRESNLINEDDRVSVGCRAQENFDILIACYCL